MRLRHDTRAQRLTGAASPELLAQLMDEKHAVPPKYSIEVMRERHRSASSRPISRILGLPAERIGDLLHDDRSGPSL